MGAEIAGLLGTLIGGCVSIGTTFLTNGHARKLQSSADSIARQERAREFQRINLLACQEQMQVMARLTGKANFEDTMAFRTGTPWNEIRLGEPLNTDISENTRKFRALVERVADDDLRAALKAVGTELSKATHARSLDDASTTLMGAISLYESTMERLGDVLRKTY